MADRSEKGLAERLLRKRGLVWLRTTSVGREQELGHGPAVFLPTLGTAPQVSLAQGEHPAGRVPAGQEVGQVVHQDITLFTGEGFLLVRGSVYQDLPQGLHAPSRSFPGQLTPAAEAQPQGRKFTRISLSIS